MKLAEEHFEEIKTAIETFFSPLKCLVQLHDYKTYIGYAVIKDGETHISPVEIRDILILNPKQLKIELKRHMETLN